jgi:hypothetical protein
MPDALLRHYEAMAGMITGTVPRSDDAMVSIAPIDEIGRLRDGF